MALSSSQKKPEACAMAGSLASLAPQGCSSSAPRCGTVSWHWSGRAWPQTIMAWPFVASKLCVNFKKSSVKLLSAVGYRMSAMLLLIFSPVARS